MVTYNSARYVEAAIESVLAQTLEDFELIIADDCSQDASWNLIQKYSDDPRVHIHKHEHNLGEFPNRIWAAGKARGRYMIFVDGDDILYPHGLELLVTTLEAFPEAGFALSQRWDERYIYPVQLDPKDVYRAHFLGRSVLSCVFPYILFRSVAYHAVGGLDPKIRTGDTYLCLRIAARYPCVLTWDGVAWWRERYGQAFRAWADPTSAVEGLRYSLELLADKDCPLDTNEREMAVTNLCGTFLREILRRMMHGHIRESLKLLKGVSLPWKSWRNLFKPSQWPYHPGDWPQRVCRTVDPLPPDWSTLNAVRKRLFSTNCTIGLKPLNNNKE
jgi:glycosyltransferase involved in cell wall biosynthesis